MFVEKEIRNFTLSNGSLVQIVIDSPFFYVYVNGTRFRTNEQPASYKSSYLSSYLHRNLGLDDRVQVKYKNYYCSLFMPDKKKRVEIEVTPSRENRIYVTARVNNATVYRKMEQKLVRLFCGIQDLEIYRQLRKEYLNCVRQYNFLSFNTEVFGKSYKILREPSEPYKEYMKNILRLMYEDACKRGFSQPVGQPFNAGVIKHDVDVPDIKVSSVENNKDVQASSVANNRDTKVSPVASNRDVQASSVANNKDVVSSMPDEKKSDDIDDDTNKDEYSLKRDKKPSFADDRKVISFEEYKRLRANGVKVDYTHYKVEYKSHEEYEERVRLLYEDHMKLNAERHRQELSQVVEQPIDAGVVKHDIDVPDIKASSDEDFGDDYASDDDYGDYSLEEDRDNASSDDNEEENLGDYSSEDDYGDYSSDDEDYGDYFSDDEDYGDYDSDDEDYGDGYFSDSDDKDYSLEEDVSNDYSNKEDSLDVSDEEKVNDLDDNTEEDVSDDNYSSEDDYGDYSSDDDSDYGDYFSDDEDNYGNDDYSSEDEYGDDYGDSSLDDEEDYGDYDVSEEDSPSDDEEDYGDGYDSDDEEDYGDGYDSDDEDFGDNY